MNGMENAKVFPYFTIYKIFTIAFFFSTIMKIFVLYRFDLFLIFTSISEIKSKITNTDILIAYNFFIVMLFCFYKLIVLYIGGDYYFSYFKFNFSYIFQIVLFSSIAVLNIFSASRSFFFIFPILLATMIISFVSHFLASLLYQLQSSIQKKYHTRLFSFNIFYIVFLLRFFIFLKKVIYITNDIYSNIYLLAILNSFFMVLSSLIMHSLYLLDIENFGNSFKVVRNCFNFQSLTILTEIILAVLLFFSFIVNDLHLSLFLPKNISVRIPFDNYIFLFEKSNKSRFSKIYYYTSPIYYFSSNANAIIELISQKHMFRSLGYLKSKSKNSLLSSHLINLFEEMRKIPFVAKITTFSISNPSSTAPFVVSTDSDPFSNYFLINSAIKSFRISPNFFHYYSTHMKIKLYYNDIKNSDKSIIKNNLINDEYEDDELQKICKVEESFFAFDPLVPQYTLVDKKSYQVQKKQNTTANEKKNHVLFINFLFYSNFASNFSNKKSSSVDFDYEILIIFTFLIYISFRLGLFFHYRKKFNESQKSWEHLILLPNATTVDLIRCQYTCIICRNKMTTKTAKRLRCHHCIHLTCLIKWTKLRNRCPLCQEEIIMSQDGNGHYSYFYSYNRNIFGYNINKHKNNRNKFLPNFVNFITNKNITQKVGQSYNNDGIGKNSDEDEQNVSPYLLFYVCSLRKFRFLKRHLLIINRKCSSNLSSFIEKKKRKMHKNENNVTMDNFANFSRNDNYFYLHNEQVSEFILNENPSLWYFLNDFYYDYNDANRIDNVNQINNLNENNNNDDENENQNQNLINNDDLINNNENNNQNENLINNDRNDRNDENDTQLAENANNVNIDNPVVDQNGNDNHQFRSYINNYNNELSSRNFYNNTNENESGEDKAARRLVSQYKSRFEYDRALIEIVIQEMQDNFPFLLKEENFLNNQQKELRKIRGASQEEIDESIQLSNKISIMIKKYRAAFKEIEDKEPWTVFCDPFDEIL